MIESPRILKLREAPDIRSHSTFIEYAKYLEAIYKDNDDFVDMLLSVTYENLMEADEEDRAAILDDISDGVRGVSEYVGMDYHRKRSKTGNKIEYGPE